MTTITAAPTTTRGARLSRYLPAIGRVLMGVPFFASGLMGLLNLVPQPSTLPIDGAAAFAAALVHTGYMMPLIFATQWVVGTLLLANRFVPLALVLIAPFIVNSIAFHLFLEHSGLPVAAIFAALEIGLVWSYRRAYAPMLALRSAPGAM